jgi:EpsI family protein
MPPSAPTAAAVAPAILAAGAAAVVYALARFWGANPDHLDRLLILLAAAYAAWEARPALAVLSAKPALVGYLPLLAGAVAFPVGWFLHAQVGPKPIVLWWLATAWVTAAAGLVLVSGGWGHLRRLAFPLGFVLFALPVPNRVLVPLQFALQSATTSAAAWALPVLGIPVERSGFILSLPSGDLGVAEACSGVRSVTALTAIAAFVAWARGFGFTRGLILVVLSIPVIAGVNAVRVVVSGLLQEHAGPDFVRGHWHEGLGIGMVLLGLGLIVLMAGMLCRKDPSPTPPPRGEGLSAPPSIGASASPASQSRLGAGGLGLLALLCTAIATVAAQFLGAGAEQELVAAAPLDQIPMRIGQWDGTDVPVSPEIAEILTPDAISHRVYRDRALGYEVHAWVIFWSSRNMVKGYHHPDVCWPNRGFRLARRDVTPVQAGGGTLPVTAREFTQNTNRQLVLYWTQEGRRVWTEEDERRVQATGDSHDWLGERLFRRQPPAATGRFVVLLGTAVWGDGKTIRNQTLDLARQIAEEMYRVCPWAAPPGG